MRGIVERERRRPEADRGCSRGVCDTAPAVTAPEILVTGAGGYVGGRLVHALRGDGRPVAAVVQRPTPYLELNGGEVVADLTRDVSTLAEACAGVRTVIHLAGQNEVVAAQEPGRALSETTLATLRVAEVAAEAGVRRIVYVSTVHVYGSRMQEDAVLSEDLRAEPTAIYAISRLASEHLLAGFAQRGIEVVALRLTNSVGAPIDPAVDRWSLVVNDLCRQGAREGRLELRTSGVQWRDFIPLGDVCRIIGAASGADGQALLPAGTYNLGSGSPITIREVAGLVQSAFERLSGARPELIAPDPPAERPRPYRVSVSRLAEHDLAASTPLEEAVEETAAFCLAHRDEI